MKIKIALIVFMFQAVCVYTFAQTSTKFNLVIGTYTNTKKSEGIYVYTFDAQTGDSELKNKITGVDNPSFLAITPDNKFIYATNEYEPNSGLSAFTYVPSTGEIKLLNRVKSGGPGPAYVAVDQQGKFVFSANYGGGSVSALPILKDGSLGEPAQTVIHASTGPDHGAKDNKSHVHSTVLSPDKKFLVTPDKGTDQVNVYAYNPKDPTKPLTEVSSSPLNMAKNSGPRHFTFNPANNTAYLIQELDASITLFDYKNGKLTPKQTVPMTAEGFKGMVAGADIHLSPDGKFLYASNRGQANEMLVYAVNKADGKITFAGRTSTTGTEPRNFAIDPTGNFLLVGNQRSNSIAVFKRDKATGLLTDTGKRIEVGAPTCLLFTPVK